MGIKCDNGLRIIVNVNTSSIHVAFCVIGGDNDMISLFSSVQCTMQ